MPSVQINNSSAYTTIKWHIAMRVDINPIKRDRIQYNFIDGECVVNKLNGDRLSAVSGTSFLVERSKSIRVTIPMAVVRQLGLKHKTVIQWITENNMVKIEVLSI